MKNIMRKIKNMENSFLSRLIVLALLAILPITASAHALEENSARITLRDGQVEIRILVDLDRWQSRLQNNQAWLLGDIKQVMPSGLTTNEVGEFLANVLNEETMLMLNNKELALTLLTATALSSNVGKATKHHEYTELVLSAKHTLSLVEQLSIRFPKSLGAVHTSFSKPKYQLIAPGSNAQVLF